MTAASGIHKVYEVPEFKVKFSDVFSLRNLYVMMHEMMLEEGWAGSKNDSDGTDVETYYSENVFQKAGHRGGKEMWIYWRLQKPPGGRPHNYFHYHLDIDMHMAYIQNIEVVHQGKKVQAQKGEIEFFFRPWIEGDPKEEWRNHWLLKNFIHIYEHRIMHKDLLKKEKEIWQEAYKVQSKIKQYLELRNYMPTPEPFFARKYGFEDVKAVPK